MTTRPRIPVSLDRLHVLGASCAPYGLTASDVAGYLADGEVMLAPKTMVADRVVPTATPISLVYLTDGVWAWSSEVAAYVARYDMDVPAEFLEHLARLSAGTG